MAAFDWQSISKKPGLHWYSGTNRNRAARTMPKVSSQLYEKAACSTAFMALRGVFRGLPAGIMRVFGNANDGFRC